MSFENSCYPPREFCNKYKKYLAPHGILISPKEVFDNKTLKNISAEDTIRKAFKITVKKLKKQCQKCANCSKECGNNSIGCSKCLYNKYCSQSCFNERLESHGKVCPRLEMEKVDQIVECLPLPFALGKDVLRGKIGPVNGWPDWFENHTSLEERINASVAIVKQWWKYSGVSNTDDTNIRSSLERIVSNVFSTVLTIGHAPYWACVEDDLMCSASDYIDAFNKSKFLEQRKDIKIHLIGADQPEVSAIASGLIQVASKILKSPIAVTLVSPDLVGHPETSEWAILKPHQVTPDVKVSAFTGLYHEFWDKYIETGNKILKVKIGKPDVCIAIHPGVHTTEMFALWRPTLELLASQEVPVVMTTYNEAEFDQTMKVISSLNLVIKSKGENPHGSLQWKQTPYEAEHVWASNAYLIVIQNKLQNCFP